MKDNIGAIWIGLLVVSIIGSVILTVGEISLLRKKGWIDERHSLSYPIVTNLVNIPVAAVSYVISIWVLFVVAMLGVGAVEFNYRKDYPDLVDAVGIVFYVFAFVFPFIIYLIVFSIVRLLTTNIMAKSSNLTWKYILGQSGLLATLLIIISFLFTATFYL